MNVAFQHMSNAGDQRNRQIVWAAVILIGLGLVVSATLLFGRKLPGLWGEWASTLIGVMTTPFLMEASFVLIGISIVALVNHVAALRSGDEWVSLESFEAAESDKDK
jgi:hypothetical protein